MTGDATDKFDKSAGAKFYDRIRARFAAVGGVDLEIPTREPCREPPRFDAEQTLDEFDAEIAAAKEEE